MSKENADKVRNLLLIISLIVGIGLALGGAAQAFLLLPHRVANVEAAAIEMKRRSEADSDRLARIEERIISLQWAVRNQQYSLPPQP